VTSWSVVDSALRPKAAYYAARRFFAPVLVSFAPNAGDVEVWGTNDFLMELGARLILRLLTFKGKVLASKTIRVRIPANESERLLVVPHSWMGKGGDYLHAVLADGRRPVSVNRYLFREPKQCDFPPAQIRLGLQKVAPGSYRALLRSNVFAPGVVLSTNRAGVFFHDNFVDLDPGVQHEVPITSRLSASALRRSLKIYALNTPNRITRKKP
jgi:beta-mannosidase